MPLKLKILLALIAMNSVLAIVTQSWVTLTINVLLAIGIVRGSEGVRTLLIILALLGLAGNALMLFVALQAVAAVGLDAFGVTIITTTAIGTAINGYFFWCLRQWDVQSWMFHRKMKGAGI